MSKPYRQIDVENLDAIRAKVFKLIPPEMMTSQYIQYNSNLSDQIMAMPEIIAAVEQFGGISQVRRVAFNINRPYTNSEPHCDYSPFNYSFNIPILNFAGTYLKMYTPDLNMTLLSYTDMFEKTVSYWEVDAKRCQLTHEIETIYPHIINTKFPHEVINNRPTVRINMLIRLKPLVLDCMS